MANGKKRKLLFSIATVVMGIIVLEVGLHVIVGIKDIFKPNIKRNPLSMFYKNREMAKQIYHETLTVIDHNDYSPFLGWANETYRSKYVNTDRKLGRKTWNPPGVDHDPQAKTLYFMGGSAAWGFGVRDDYTVPSDLSKLLHEHGYKFRVFNYGEPGYTFKQGVMHLILLLRNGRRPDYVIFYDGFNDIYAAHQQGYAGTTHNLFMIEERIKLRYREAIWRGFKEAIRKYSMIYKAITRLMNINTSHKYQEVATHYDDQKLHSLSRDIITEYKKSLDLLDNLSKIYSFKYICLWQPNVFTEKHIVKGELVIRDPREDDHTFKKLCIYSEEILQKEHLKNFYDLTDVLYNRTKPVYIDIAHISEGGSVIVAKKIYQIFEKECLTQPGIQSNPQSKVKMMPHLINNAEAMSTNQIFMRAQQNMGVIMPKDAGKFQGGKLSNDFGASPINPRELEIRTDASGNSWGLIQGGI